MVSPRHQLQMKQQKKVHNYSHKPIDYFKVIVVNKSPKLTDKEKWSIATSFGDFLSILMY